MKSRSNTEITKKMAELWPTAEVRDIDYNEPSRVAITISAMYDPPGLSLSTLLKLAEFFGTKEIVDTRFSRGGCETCDYGSSYGFTLRITPEK